MWSTFWNFLWTTIVIFAFVAYLIILFNILTDLFWRDRETAGIVKAIWVVFLVVLPYLTALIYLIARGKGMGERAVVQAASTKREADDYIRELRGGRRRRTSSTRRNCWTKASSRATSSTN